MVLPSEGADIGSLVLVGPGHLNPQFLRGVPGPVWVAQRRARQHHRVGMAVRHDLLGLHRVGDEAHRDDRHPGGLRRRPL